MHLCFSLFSGKYWLGHCNSPSFWYRNSLPLVFHVNVIGKSLNTSTSPFISTSISRYQFMTWKKSIRNSYQNSYRLIRKNKLNKVEKNPFRKDNIIMILLVLSLWEIWNWKDAYSCMISLKEIVGQLHPRVIFMNTVSLKESFANTYPAWEILTWSRVFFNMHILLAPSGENNPKYVTFKLKTGHFYSNKLSKSLFRS